MATRWRCAAGVALAVCSALAAPAAANDTDRARDVARAYWGAEPCGGAIAIRWTELAPHVNASARWSNPTSAFGNATENRNCGIDFNTAVAWNWPRLCSVTVHEYGHLLGHDHSADPADVMHHYYERPLAACAPPKARQARTPPQRRARRGHLVPVGRP